MLELTQEQIMQNWPVKNTETPLVSVRCITYNHEPYIAQALDGFLIQKTDFPFEVIIHDDASTDKTADIIREYEKKYPLIIKPIYQKENQYSKRDGSIAKAINHKLKGKYIAYCEGDDYWIDENKLQMQVDFLERNPEFSAYYCNVKVIDESGNDISKKYPGFCDQRRQVYEQNLSRFTLPGQLSGLVCKNYIFILTKSQYNTYLNIKCNGDVKLVFLLNGLGKIFMDDSKLSVYRRTYNTDSWNSRIKNKNMSLYFYNSMVNIIYMMKNIFGSSLDATYLLHGIIYNSFYIFISSPNLRNWKIFRILLKKRQNTLFFIVSFFSTSVRQLLYKNSFIRKLVRFFL